MAVSAADAKSSTTRVKNMGGFRVISTSGASRGHAYTAYSTTYSTAASAPAPSVSHLSLRRPESAMSVPQMTSGGAVSAYSGPKFRSSMMKMSEGAETSMATFTHATAGCHQPRSTRRRSVK